MKISNGKKQLAKIISENGGWFDGANWAIQGRQTMGVGFSKSKPYRKGDGWFVNNEKRLHHFATDVLLPDWHQTVIHRAEYFHLYPAQDAEAEEPEHVWTNPPTIEQLATEYRSRKDYAERKQQEADYAKAEAEAKLKELVAAGKAVGLVVSVAGPERVITDWRDLMVGDEVECVGTPNGATCKPGMFGVVTLVDGRGVEAAFDDAMSSKEKGAWFSTEGRCFRFIRRPSKEADNA